MVVYELFVRSTRKYKYRTYRYIYINGNSPLVCDTASGIAIETIMTIMRICKGFLNRLLHESSLKFLFC